MVGRAFSRFLNNNCCFLYCNMLTSLSCDPEYPHKYGPEGGCADSSVFDRMKKYQASALEEPAKVRRRVFNCVQSLLSETTGTNALSLQEKRSEEQQALLRKKRMTQVEKNTCQLFIQTDHLFYKYYKTREAVIAQVRPCCVTALIVMS